MKKRNAGPLGTLTAQDLFYVKVTKIHELFKVFANMSDELLKREQSTARVSQILLDISTIILVSQSSNMKSCTHFVSLTLLADDVARSVQVQRTQVIIVRSTEREEIEVRVFALDRHTRSSGHSGHITSYHRCHYKTWNPFNGRARIAAKPF